MFALEKLCFLIQIRRINNHSVRDKTHFLWKENPRRDEMQHIRFVFVDNRMAGVVAPLIPNNQIGLLREIVNNFSFSFIAPLSSDDHESRHCHTFLIEFIRKITVQTLRRQFKRLPNNTNIVFAAPRFLSLPRWSKNHFEKIKSLR